MNCQISLELSKGTATELNHLPEMMTNSMKHREIVNQSPLHVYNHYSNCECCCTHVTCISFVSWSWLNTHTNIAVPCLTLKNDHPIPFPTCTAFSTISWTGSKPNLSGLRVRSLSWSNSSSEDASKPFKTIQYAIWLYSDIWRGMNNKQINYFGWSEGYQGELADTLILVIQQPRFWGTRCWTILSFMNGITSRFTRIGFRFLKLFPQEAV